MKIIFLFLCFCYLNLSAQHGNKFEPLGTILPTPNEYRTASGAPGSKYWQQRADYHIKCKLDEQDQRISGDETITYYNNSPDVLTYLWFQLEENIYTTDRNANYQYNNAVPEKLSPADLKKWEDEGKKNEYGVNITSLTDGSGAKLNYTINRTMMRVDLPVALKSGQQYILKISWNYKLTNRMVQYGRGGYEKFPDGNNLYTVTHWYPRLCLYSDYAGWHNQQYANKEFALTFGNFKVEITLPVGQIVGATGECRNYKDVLSPDQYTRLQKAKISNAPLDIVTLDEAQKNGRTVSSANQTWIFEAENVRDFAWTACKRFIWDGMNTTISGKNIFCMSYYPKESYPVYHEYSTKLVAHTLKFYSNQMFPYPYPVAQSVEASNGIEFPMICFNYGRVEKDGSFSDDLKREVAQVVIHEVGHNWFPMIINTDERQYAWMDEGFDTFFEFLATKAWDSLMNWPRGAARGVGPALKQTKEFREPIMIYPDNSLAYSFTSYFKPSVALNVLRDAVMGHEKFDAAFKTYASRWAFKHPTPADFFRTMEDASAEDLDWFWRGWFYGIELCDISLDTVKLFTAGPNKYFYQVEMSNKGGLVSPIIIQFNFADGTSDIERIPAQAWRHNESRHTKSYMKTKKVSSIVIDPHHETADTDESNNTFKRFGTPVNIPIN
jgi:hypothetical protein